MSRFQLPLAAIVAMAALASPAAAAQVTAVAAVNIVKPASLMKLQDMDFGTLTFSGFTGTRTISLSRTGTRTCAAEIVCSGVAKQARFNLQGTNKQTTLITVAASSLSNGVDSIPFTPDGTQSIYIPNSGSPGIDFDVGGSLTVSPALVGGTYSGTITVTAEYQ